MKNKFKVGIAGMGRGASFIRPFEVITETEVTAICDPRQEVLDRVSSEYNIPNKFKEYEDMLKSDVDIVVLATPENLHVPQSIAALEAGKHVISEVTAAVSLDQCYDLVRAVKKAKTKYMMAENQVYWTQNLVLKNMVQKGLFGDVYYGEGEMLHDIKFLHKDAQGNPTWRYYWQVGINRCNYATHSLGPVMSWFNERVVSVCCQGTGKHTDPEKGMDDTVVMMCKTEKGGLIKIRIDMLSNRPPNTFYALQGTKGCFEGTRGMGDERKIWLSDLWPDAGWHAFKDIEKDFLPDMLKNPPEEVVRAGEQENSEYYEMRDFVDSILNDTEPPLGIYYAMDLTMPGIMSEESIKQGGAPVEVPDFRKMDI